MKMAQNVQLFFNEMISLLTILAVAEIWFKKRPLCRNSIKVKFIAKKLFYKKDLNDLRLDAWKTWTIIRTLFLSKQN